MRPTSISAFLLAIAMLPGCASLVALNTHGPTHDDLIETEMRRMDVESILDTEGTSHLEATGMTRARYEYADGPNELWKLRSIVWFAADVFTLFLSEIIFWPIELAINSSAERTAEAIYDSTNRLVYFRSIKTKNEGEVMRIGEEPPIRLYAVHDGRAFVLGVPGQMRVDASVARVLNAVPAGEYFSGCDESMGDDCYENEKPGKLRQLESFEIDTTEVTVAAFRECVAAGACTPPESVGACNWGREDRERHPINCVACDQAEAYCAWNSKRLPSEWEWEKAARGTDGRKYPWGNEDADCRRAVIEDAAGSACGQGETTFEVGSQPSGLSPYGVLDMAGNVWEWTKSTPAESSICIARGGSWFDTPRSARASFRAEYPGTSQMATIGFRCAVSVNRRVSDLNSLQNE